MGDYKELISAIRCSATSYSGCTADCPYRLLEEIKPDFPMPADVVVDGVGYWVSCDCDKMSLDAADAIEHLVKERDAAVEDIKKCWLCASCHKHIEGKEWCFCYSFAPETASDGCTT